MAFDVTEYAQALEEFLGNMMDIPEVVHPGTQSALERVCKLLRVAKAEVTLFENPSLEARNVGKLAVLYQSSTEDKERFFEKREVTGKGEVAVYRLYQRIDDEDWNATEYEKIQLIEMMLFAFHGRARVMGMVEKLTFTDQQLGIYNLTYFMKYLGEIIARGEIDKYGVVYFNLRRFSLINQQIGRKRGTQVLKDFVTGLQEKLSDHEIVCRIGGDNFISLFLKEHIECVQEYLKGTSIVYDEERKGRVMVAAYAGYYMIDNPCLTPMDIMDCVSVAFNIAKNVLKSDNVFYDDKVVESRNYAKKIEAMFPAAIENEEFQVFYQPKVLLKDYKMAGAEALCRWKRDGKLIPPGEFIPILEQGNSICTLDFYMLDHVCRDIRRWMDEGRKVVKISVNLSRRHFDDMELLQHILEIIDRNHVPHEFIEIELTETTTDVDFKDLRKIVSGLREEGICTSVDDFGVGYSSLNLIRESPWNVIKIDRTFLPVGNEKEDEQKRIMLKYLITMFQDMGLSCIVEGVETAEQIKLLKENNCYLVQGFYFDKPLSVEEFEKRLDELDKEE